MDQKQKQYLLWAIFIGTMLVLAALVSKNPQTFGLDYIRPTDFNDVVRTLSLYVMLGGIAFLVYYIGRHYFQIFMEWIREENVKSESDGGEAYADDDYEEEISEEKERVDTTKEKRKAIRRALILDRYDKERYVDLSVWSGVKFGFGFAIGTFFAGILGLVLAGWFVVEVLKELIGVI